MATQRVGSQREAVLAAYRTTAAEAQRASAFRLRWQFRRWTRLHDQLDPQGLARLAAVRDELRARGEIVPAS